MSFDVKRKTSSVKTVNYTNNIFGFIGKKENGAKRAHRLPRVWFKRGTFRITIFFLAFDITHKYTHNQDIDSVKFTNFKVVQYQKHSGKYVYEIYADGRKVFGGVNNDPREFEDVKVFFSTRWNRPCHCIVRNFIYSNLE